ncbi:intraflagellar transport protein 74 homolog [Bacillus rossius redtenbacheri]|uniref:intraflagellar transport protein 74 homolog n=1 Tax=Bacillus rossius redtenbacheri TaxID=93214 RepID=UPI002FDECB3A
MNAGTESPRIKSVQDDNFSSFDNGTNNLSFVRRNPRIQKIINEHKQGSEELPISIPRMMSRKGAAPGDRPPSAPRGGTASRLASALSQQPPPRSSVARALTGAQVSVLERPVTQQGLSGLRPPTRAPQARQVQDKRYFQGLLQVKARDLSLEIARLTKEIETHSREQATFLVYDKRVKEMASQLTDLQGQLADHNLVVDKMNTETEKGEVDAESRELRAANDRRAAELEELFAQRQLRDGVVQRLEQEIHQERRMADNLLAAMSPSLRSRYAELQETSSQLQQQMDELQQQLDTLTARKTLLEDQLSLSRVKQEAARLHHRLGDAQRRRDALLEEERARSSPAQEREQLLQRVRQDNAETAAVERRLAQLREAAAARQGRLDQLDKDLAESSSDRHQKYVELRQREEAMEQFLSQFEQSRADETVRAERLEAEIVAALQEISLHLAHSGNLPSTEHFSAMKQDLSAREGELERSRETFHSLSKEQRQLQFTLEKVGAMEDKMKAEMAALQQRVEAMRAEMGGLADLDGLRDAARSKRERLEEEQRQLSRRREPARQHLLTLQEKHTALQKQLNENETHSQLSNLERKLAQLEQNNFAVKEFVASKKSETDYEPLKSSVVAAVQEYNSLLKESLKSGVC